MKAKLKDCPVGYFHGFMGSHADGAFLESLFKEIVPFDLSQPPEIEEPFIENIERLNELKLPILYGYSMGGRILINLLKDLKYEPQLIILESVGLPLKDPHKRKERKELDLIRAQEMHQDFRGFLKKWYNAPMWGPLTAEEKEKLSERRLKVNIDQLDVLTNQLTHFSPGVFPVEPGPFPPEIPTLYMAGAEDEKYAGLALELAALSQGGESLFVKVFEGAGHNISLTHAKEILEFIQLIHDKALT